MNKILMGDDGIPAWMTHGRTVRCQKDAVGRYLSISCLQLMWKLLTGMLFEETYDYLEQEKLLPEEQNGCRRGSRRTKHQLLDKTVERF